MKFKDILEFYKNRSCQINMRDNGRIELTFLINREGKTKTAGTTYHTGKVTEIYDDFIVFERTPTHQGKGGVEYVLNHIFQSDLITITRIVDQADEQ